MAKTIGKKTRLCKLSSKAVESQLDTFAKLVSKPQYVCLKCHRVANSKTNLCEPRKLPK